VRKETTASGNVRFVAESNEAGHADDFWAHALAIHAAKPPADGAITDPTAIRYGSNFGGALLAPRRVFTPRTVQEPQRVLRAKFVLSSAGKGAHLDRSER
jgi:hypothetical protein